MANIKTATIKEVKEISEKAVSLLGVKGEIFVSAEEGHVKVNIESEDSALLIGHAGENLFALRYVLALVCREILPEGTSLTLDVGDYLKGREKRIEKMIQDAVEKVKKTGRQETLPPMNSYERMIAHQKATSTPGISSRSEGIGQNRQVVISKGKNLL